MTDEVVEVWGGRLSMHVKIAGAGPPLVYLHAAGGPVWDPFLDALARDFTVHMIEHPGMSAGEPDAIHAVDTFGELLLIYEEVVRALGIAGAVAVGQSYGAMIAADLAAHFPGLFARVVLLAPVGLWLEDAPVRLPELMTAPPEELPALLFHDPTGPAAQAMFTPPDDPELAIAMGVGLVWALGCSAKFLWPVPDQGLARRAHRIAAPALVIWGEEDPLVPVAHAAEFGRLIADCRVELLSECGHIAQMEQPDRTLALVSEFLA